jgi:hypothetical protein
VSVGTVVHKDYLTSEMGDNRLRGLWHANLSIRGAQTIPTDSSCPNHRIDMDHYKANILRTHHQQTITQMS